MKKLLAIICTAVLLLALAGCGTKDNTSGGSNGVTSVSGGYKDGDYTVDGTEYDDKGYKMTVTVTVKDGSVYAVNCDAVNQEGVTKKSISESGNYNMKAYGNSQAEWHEEIAEFEKYIVSNGVKSVSVDGEGKTDTIAGCTITVGPYIELVSKALEKASE